MTKPSNKQKDKTAYKLYKKPTYDFTMKPRHKGRRHPNANQPTFSILLQSYNGADALNRSISSVLNQKYEDWELILFDNGSSDPMVWTMMAHAMEADSRIRAFHADEPMGWPKGMDLCLNHTAGKYMTVLSAGDCLHPNALAAVNDEIVRYAPDVVWVGFSFTSYLESDFYVINSSVPSMRVLTDGDKVQNIYEVLHTVSYRMLFHYINIEFLRKHDVTFYEVYHANAVKMTQMITNAKSMVVLDQLTYYLTSNSPQTKEVYLINGYQTIFTSQWSTLKKTLLEEGVFSMSHLHYFAKKVVENYFASLQILCEGKECQDAYGNMVDIRLAARFKEMEDAFSQSEIMEIMEHCGRRHFHSALINILDSFHAFASKSEENPYKSSNWLKTVFQYMYADNRALYFKPLTNALLHPKNKGMIGFELFAEDVDQMEDRTFSQVMPHVVRVMVAFGRSSKKLLLHSYKEYITSKRLKPEYYTEFYQFFLNVYNRAKNASNRDKELEAMKRELEEIMEGMKRM